MSIAASVEEETIVPPQVSPGMRVVWSIPHQQRRFQVGLSAGRYRAKDEAVVDLRLYWRNTGFPTRTGIQFPASQLAELRAALEDAEARIAALPPADETFTAFDANGDEIGRYRTVGPARRAAVEADGYWVLTGEETPEPDQDFRTADDAD